MKKFKIKNKITSNNKDGYYVLANFMYGDADGYTDKKIGPFKKDEEIYLSMFLDMLDKCLNAFPNGRGGFDEYEDKVEELKMWNTAYEYEDEEDESDYIAFTNLSKEIIEVIERIGFEWPVTPDGWSVQASIKDYKVVYIENNVTYKVDVTDK